NDVVRHTCAGAHGRTPGEQTERGTGPRTHQPEVLERIAALGADPVGGPPQRLVDHLPSEIPKWSRVIREANIKL
ncbi:MAG: hypothetical protein ACXWC0_12025, partial [Burkholderiales bacterium]